MMEKTDQTLFLEKMQAISNALAENGASPTAMRVLLDSLADFLGDDDSPDKGNGERRVLVDILSNNVVWVARNGVEREKERRVLAAREQSLNSVHRALLKTNMELRERSMIDDLTGLFNRRYFERSLSYDLERLKRYRRPFGVVLFDVDRFKLINDTYGHSIGDTALQHLSDLAARLIRSADILARYGGEEFTLLLPETDLAGTKTAAERLRACVSENPFDSQKGSVSMTISLGITSVDGDFKGTADDVMGCLDKALYRAKDLGRNKVVVV